MEPKTDISHPQPLFSSGHICGCSSSRHTQLLSQQLAWTLRRHRRAGRAHTGTAGRFMVWEHHSNTRVSLEEQLGFSCTGHTPSEWSERTWSEPRLWRHFLFECHSKLRFKLLFKRNKQLLYSADNAGQIVFLFQKGAKEKCNVNWEG